jgi:hypothetical protein
MSPRGDRLSGGVSGLPVLPLRPGPVTPVPRHAKRKGTSAMVDSSQGTNLTRPDVETELLTGSPEIHGRRGESATLQTRLPFPSTWRVQQQHPQCARMRRAMLALWVLEKG